MRIDIAKTFKYFGILFTAISLASSAITIGYFKPKYDDLSNYDYIYEYKPTICNINRGFALNLTCGKWISVLINWNDVLTVENPFELRATRIEAIEDRYRIPMGMNITCVCRYVESRVIRGQDCSYWPPCILDQSFISYVQRDNDRYASAYYSFIVASIFSVVLCSISIAAFIWEYACQKPEPKKEYIPI